MMKILVLFCRIIVGSLFIFSGVIKANDTIGFSYKLSEYFTVFGLDFLMPFAVFLSFSITIFEIFIGCLLISGKKRNFTSWSLLIMILFFTFLTFYSAYFNKVTDCGCFGDAIKLTPWESFIKDIILLFCILIIFFNQHLIIPFPDFSRSVTINKINWIILGLSIAFPFYTYNYLPVKDFRPYAINKNIKEGMKTCYELGLPCTEEVTIYIVKDKNTGEMLRMDSNEWSQKMDQYDFVSATEDVKIITKGYEPPIHDFSIELNGYDITDSILESNIVYLFICYDITKSSDKNISFINKFYENCQKDQITFIGVSASSYTSTNNFSNKYNIMFDYAFSDETALKTIIRSNPGLIKIEKGQVTEKWHYNNFGDLIK